MTAKSKALVRRRPDGLNLRDAIAQEGDAKGGQKSWTKQATTMKLADGEELLGIESMRPSDEQVEKVNSFTRSVKSADELLVFPTLSCNDMMDRDDEAFKGPGGASVIQEFASLDAPYSFVGKSFMMDHDYTVSKQIGRIFDESVETLSIDGAGDVEFLKHWIYMPNTKQFADIAEKMDFGIQWAVSVGVVMDAASCVICESPMYNGHWMSFCYENGHEKGLWYDPDSDEKDDYGWAIPVEEGTKGAVKSQVLLHSPRDGYELSSVFLGAQYFAALEKDPSFKGVVKAASARKLPIIGLSAKDAESLSIPHEPEEVRDARSKFTVDVDKDGDSTWTDEKGLVWVYDSKTSKVLNLAADESEEDSDGEEGQRIGGTPPGEVVRADGDEVPSGDDEPDGEGGESAGPEGVPAADLGGSVVGEGDDPAEGLNEPAADVAGEEKQVKGKASAIALAKEAGVPESLITAAESAQVVGDRGALKTILNGLVKQNKELTGLAAVGTDHIDGLKAVGVKFYTMANTVSGEKGVDTAAFRKMLDKCDDDVELLKSMVEDQRRAAQAKFPEAVRRSTFESDHNSRDTGMPVEVSEMTQQSVGVERTAKAASAIHR